MLYQISTKSRCIHAPAELAHKTSECSTYWGGDWKNVRGTVKVFKKDNFLRTHG